MVIRHEMAPGTEIVTPTALCLISKGEDFAQDYVNHRDEAEDEWTAHTAVQVTQPWDPVTCEYPHIYRPADPPQTGLN